MFLPKSNSNFIMFKRGHMSDWLQEEYPNAFLLLCQIAKRARYFEGHPDGKEIGMAEIGDYKKAGLQTEKIYRNAKKKLEELEIIEIIETNRKLTGEKSKKKNKKITCAKGKTKNVKKRATKKATNGTLVKLLNSDIWDINSKRQGDPKGDRRATEGRPKGDEQEAKESEDGKQTEEAKQASERAREEQEQHNIQNPTLARLSPDSPLFSRENKKPMAHEVEERANEILLTCNNSSLNIPTKTMKTWVRKYWDRGKGYIIDHVIMLFDRIKKGENIKQDKYGAWLETALSRDYLSEKKHISHNKAFAINFKKEKAWNELEILERYARVSDGIEYYYYLPPESFEPLLTAAYNYQS